MPVSYKVVGSDVEVDFKYSGSIASIQAIATDCSEYLWIHGFGNHGTDELPITFAELNDQGKLDVIDGWVAFQILEYANKRKMERAQEELTITNHEFGV